jgi:hypothetical protein
MERLASGASRSEVGRWEKFPIPYLAIPRRLDFDFNQVALTILTLNRQANRLIGNNAANPDVG